MLRTKEHLPLEDNQAFGLSVDVAMRGGKASNQDVNPRLSEGTRSNASELTHTAAGWGRLANCLRAGLL